MIYTSSYKNFKTELYKSVSISFDKGKDAGFKKDSYTLLAPKKTFWKVWKNNIGKINESDNNEYYIKEYYKQVLSKLNPDKVYNDLYNSFLLCYEDSNMFCHRHIVAAWLELLLDIEIKEVKVDGLLIEEMERPEDIKKTLEQIIKENINMRGFNSLRALYLFNLGEEFERDANLYEEKYNKSYDYYRQAAAYLRSDADIAEEKYNNKVKIKKLINNE